MNITNFQHALYALLMQGFLFVVTGNPWIGAAFAIGFFLSREHAQRQVDIKITTGVGIVGQNPFDGFRGWSLDAKLDALFPAIAVILATVIYGYS